MQRHEDNLRLGTEVGEMCLIRELVGKYVLMKIKLGHHRYDDDEDDLIRTFTLYF